VSNHDEPALILIIDDLKSSRDELAAMVESLGHRALLASSGLDGLRLVREAQPSLVLLDVLMPGLDGFKIAAAIKAQPRFVPVMLLTGLDDLDSKRRGQAAGADDCLTKPVSSLELQIRIAAMLRIKSLTDALDAANRRLAELADTDGLTGIANRRRFDGLCAHEHERAQRYQRPLTLLLADIDHFKRVNDTYGHALGDAVLRAVASALAGSLRQSDHVGRLGGEEFGVLAPEVGPAGALALGERLRHAVEQMRVEAPDGPVEVSASFGAVAWDGQGTVEVATLLKRADDALYQAKQSGRNRVVLFIVRGAVS
jgi:diguanylate cyclase (GGDEF)-like protein